jgi:hypothetical protein
MEVEKVKGSLSVVKGMVVDVSVTKGTSSNSVSTDTDGSDRSNLLEEFEKLGLIDIRVQISNIERS